jgi:pyruvate dehydrogenase E2 component (dihydrolipoamide acetyltransferase)
VALFEYKMPELGEGLHEGEIVKWHIKAGDSIEEDDLLLDVQNDKSVVEVPSPVSGKIKDIKVSEGTVSVVGDVLATIEVEGELPPSGHSDHGTEDQTKESSPEPAKNETQTEHQEAQAGNPVDPAGNSEAPSSKQAQDSGEKADPRLILATPSVRKFAREQDVNLSDVKGSGKNGRITREDVLSVKDGGTAQAEPKASQAEAKQEEKAVSASASQASQTGQQGNREEEREPIKGIRKAISNAMVKSVYTAPHVTVMDEVDVSGLVEFRQKVKPLAEEKGVKLTYLPFIVKALMAAARQFPVLNASVDDEKSEIIHKKYYNIGIATDTDQGLIVPVIHDADRKNIWTIASEIKDLAVRGREGKLAPHEMKGGTITITNIGSAGGMFFTPVINHPEVAILGTGRISEKPIVKNGEVTVGQMMALSLSFDHRIIDGATAQYAVNYIKKLLEDPQMLVLEV